MAHNSKKSRTRGFRLYEKPALTHEELLDRLIERGLIVDDMDRTLRYLRHIGYYRFSPYLIPFRLFPSDEQLDVGVRFDQVLDVYVFDRKLRLLLLDAIERIEVAIRSALTDHMSIRYEDPFWYSDGSHFKNGKVHRSFLNDIEKQCDFQLNRDPEQHDGKLMYRSALEHYLLTYGEPRLPPSWVVMELLTIGQLERTIKNLRRRSDLGRIGKSLGVPAPVLESWLANFVRVRNISAHHGRLWNVGLGVVPAIPKDPRVPWLRDRSYFAENPIARQRLYPTLVATQSLLSVISPRSTWSQRLYALLEEHPQVPLQGMGIPEGWFEDDFWASRLSQTTSASLGSAIVDDDEAE